MVSSVETFNLSQHVPRHGLPRRLKKSEVVHCFLAYGYLPERTVGAHSEATTRGRRDGRKREGIRERLGSEACRKQGRERGELFHGRATAMS